MSEQIPDDMPDDISSSTPEQLADALIKVATSTTLDLATVIGCIEIVKAELLAPDLEIDDLL